MSDSLQDWTTYYQQLAEASRFAAAVQAQPSLQDSWRKAVTAAFAGGTVTAALGTLDSWISSAGYDTLSHMALDAVMPATPQPGDIYGPWRQRLSEITVTNGTRELIESMNDDSDSASAFSDQLTQYAITRLSSESVSPDDGAPSDASVSSSPDEELTYVTMLDARGTENIDAWIASQAVNVSPSPDIAQVVRALFEQAGADLAQWVGDYGNASTQLVGYNNSAGVAGVSVSGVGPRIVVGGDQSGLQLYLDGTVVQNPRWEEGPKATWTSGGGNAVGGTANFGYVANVDQGTATGRKINGALLVPSSVGNRYGGLSLAWPAGATSATISFEANQIAGTSSGGSDPRYEVPIVTGIFSSGVIACLIYLVCKQRSARALNTLRLRSTRGNASGSRGDVQDDSRAGLENENGSRGINVELGNINPGSSNVPGDVGNIGSQIKDTTDQAGHNIQHGADESNQNDERSRDEEGQRGREPEKIHGE